MADRLVIWPAYLDSQKSRSDGRKISGREAVEAPTLKQIRAAAEKLGLAPKVDKEKAYPKEWWEVSGCVTVDKAKPKSQVLKDIARQIRKARG
jgi:signal recognition particle subunit SRP19